jgi:hypothetical protein
VLHQGLIDSGNNSKLDIYAKYETDLILIIPIEKVLVDKWRLIVNSKLSFLAASLFAVLVDYLRYCF